MDCLERESRSEVSNSATPWTSMEFSMPEYWSGKPFPSSGDLPNSGIEPRSPTLQMDSLPVEPPGKPKNTGVGSLSLLQWNFWAQESNLSLLQGIFPTQGSNPGLQHCRWVLYQLSYKGNPDYLEGCSKRKKISFFRQ